ncbi:hypothetical protein FACS1894110_18460 [Spirochaetia bacterium]|nr:hypothetical protein FACS1894110_18460 [Spirochaetia bacterium]
MKECGSYLFIRLFETGPDVRLAKSLDEFLDFCHYVNLSDTKGVMYNHLPGQWDAHKQEILKDIQERGVYVLDGNDVVYIIVQHESWSWQEDDEYGGLSIPFEKLRLKVEKFGDGWTHGCNKERAAIKDVLKGRI